MDDPILTTREAAHILGVSIRTVQTWIEQREIDSWKTPGGHRRVRRSEVLALRERLATQQKDGMFAILSLSKESASDERWKQLNEIPGVCVTACDDALFFLIEAGHQMPAAIIVELTRSDWQRIAVIRRILSSPRLAHTQVVLITDMKSEQIQLDIGEHCRLHVLESSDPTREADCIIEVLSLRQLQHPFIDSHPYPVAADEPAKVNGSAT